MPAGRMVHGSHLLSEVSCWKLGSMVPLRTTLLKAGRLLPLWHGTHTTQGHCQPPEVPCANCAQAHTAPAAGEAAAPHARQSPQPGLPSQPHTDLPDEFFHSSPPEIKMGRKGTARRINEVTCVKCSEQCRTEKKNFFLKHSLCLTGM